MVTTTKGTTMTFDQNKALSRLIELRAKRDHRSVQNQANWMALTEYNIPSYKLEQFHSSAYNSGYDDAEIRRLSQEIDEYQKLPWYKFIVTKLFKL